MFFPLLCSMIRTLLDLSSVCLYLWYLGMGIYTRNIREVNCLGHNAMRKTTITGRSSLRLQGRECIAPLWGFFFFLPQWRRLWCGRGFTVTNPCADIWLDLCLIVTMQSTSSLDCKPLVCPPFANTATSALMMLASSLLQERPPWSGIISGIVRCSRVTLEAIGPVRIFPPSAFFTAITGFCRLAKTKSRTAPLAQL